jgi:hypothetical protein
VPWSRPAGLHYLQGATTLDRISSRQVCKKQLSDLLEEKHVYVNKLTIIDMCPTALYELQTEFSGM